MTIQVSSSRALEMLFEKKKNHVMTYTDKNGQQVEASSPALASNLKASDNEQVRLSSHQAFLDLGLIDSLPTND